MGKHDKDLFKEIISRFDALQKQLAEIQKQQQQAPVQTQSQPQNSETTTISNVGNTHINIHTSGTTTTPASSEDNNDEEEEEEESDSNTTRPSAFRAVNNANQALPANTPTKVLYQVEQFDLANEYTPGSSTFQPEKRGVYSIIGTMSFFPNDPTINYRARVEIRINGNATIAVDNDFFGGGVVFSNVVAVSSIVQLEANDRVEIFAESNTAGTIMLDGLNSTHFEAARLPSPTE